MKVIILAGGGGTRLYPLSTAAKPKQFLPLADGKPLIINTVERFLPIAAQNDIIIVTGKSYEKVTQEILHDNNLTNVNVVCESCARNTAPAIALGVKYLVDVQKIDCHKEVIFVVPSDHVITPLEKYLDCVNIACKGALQGSIVTLGLVPSCADTGFGYIKADGKTAEIMKVEQFKEKPDLATAEKYVSSGQYYWNAGMFCFTENTFANELKNNVTLLYNLYSQGYNTLRDNFEQCAKVSIDYAIAEHSKNISVVPANVHWSDIGSWDAYYDFCNKDACGNVLIGKVKAIDCKNCLIAAYADLISVANLTDVIVIGNTTGTIVLPRGKSQRTKEFVE